MDGVKPGDVMGDVAGVPIIVEDVWEYTSEGVFHNGVLVPPLFSREGIVLIVEGKTHPPPYPPVR